MGIPDPDTGPTPSGPKSSTPGAAIIRLETGIRLGLGLMAVSAALLLLSWRGYQGWPVGLLGGVCSASGIYALVRAAQCWRGQLLRLRAVVLATAAGLILAVSSCCFLSQWVQEINETQAWRRHQQTTGMSAYERYWAYNLAVPEPFRRRQAEADYLLDMVRSGRQPHHHLRWTLEDVENRYGDDPAFEEVRHAIRKALTTDSAT